MIESLATALLLYFEVSLLVGVGYFVYRSVRWLTDREVVDLDWAGLMHFGRTLFLAGLLTPLVAHLFLAAADAAIRFGPLASTPTLPVVQSAPIGSQSGAGWGVELLDRGPSWIADWLNPARVELGIGIIAALLVAGVLIASAATLGRVLRLRSLLRTSVSVRRHGRVRIVVSDRIEVPFSTAIFGGSHIVLPVDLLRHPKDLRIVLRHELQHYRHGDQRWTIGLELFRILFFWHPAAYLWARDLMNLQELACDEALVRRGTPVRDYGNCLIRVASMAVQRRMIASTAMATASDRGVTLARRIEMLFDHKKGQASRRTRRTACAVGTLIVLAAAQVTALSWPSAADLPKSDTTADVETLRTHAMVHHVSVDSVASSEDRQRSVVELVGSLESIRALLESLTLEMLDISQLRLDKHGDADRVHATAVLDGSAGDPGIMAVFNEGLDLLSRETVSSLKLELDGDSVTVFVRDANSDCATDSSHDGVFDAVPQPLAAGLRPLTPEAGNLEFSNLDGSTFRLSHLSGKVTLLDFWAAWCRHCKNEVPHLKALDRELGGADFEILGVSLSRDREEFEAFVAEHDVSWPQLHVENAWRSTAARAFDIKAVPSHILIDRQGRFMQVPLGNPAALSSAVRDMIARH